MTKTQSATKKKLPGWAIALIVIGTIIVVLGVAVGIFFLIPTDNRVVGAAGQTDAVFNVNGYQRGVADVSTIATHDGAQIVSIETMLKAENLDINNPDHKAKIASYIYNMAVRNFAAAQGAAYEVLTDATVSAKDVKSLMTMDFFDVGIRSTYSQMNGPQGFFSQTISGVTKLDLGGSPLGDKIKGLFGWNVQNFSNSTFKADRKSSNGGALFLNEDEQNYKYILGATKKDGTEFPKKVKKGDNYFTTAAVTPGTPSHNTLFDGKQWDPLPDNKQGVLEDAGKLGAGVKYDLGDYGAGWAKYGCRLISGWTARKPGSSS